MTLSSARVSATLPASDFERAKSYYSEKLGFTPVEDTPTGALYEAADGVQFLVFPSVGVASGTHTQIAFDVDDVASEVAALKDRGVVFEEYDLPDFKTVDGILKTQDMTAAFFKDSEGNLIGVATRHA